MNIWKKYKVLIVEDEMALYTMYKMKFEKEWFETAISTNWVDASVKIQTFKPDVILLDIMMPDMDWFETLKVLKEQTSLQSKIVMFSNLNRPIDIQEAKQMWADDYIVKADVTPREVVDRIKALLTPVATFWEILKNNDQLPIEESSECCPHCGKPL